MEADMGAGAATTLTWELELQPHKSRELQLDPSQIRVLGQNGGSEPKWSRIVIEMGLPGAAFKTRKMSSSLPAAGHKNPTFPF